jgi:hypothetical protein
MVIVITKLGKQHKKFHVIVRARGLQNHLEKTKKYTPAGVSNIVAETWIVTMICSISLFAVAKNSNDSHLVMMQKTTQLQNSKASTTHGKGKVLRYFPVLHML